MFYYKRIFKNNHFSVLGATLWVSDITSLGIIQLCYRNFNVHGCSTICTLSCPADNYRLANFRSNSSQRNHRNRIHRDGKQLLKNKIRHMFNFFAWLNTQNCLARLYFFLHFSDNLYIKWYSKMINMGYDYYSIPERVCCISFNETNLR